MDDASKTKNALADDAAATGDDAKRDGQGIYLSGGSLEGVVEGPMVTMDALCQFRHYHGDLGRTTTLGEPTPQMVQLQSNKRAPWAWTPSRCIRI